MPENNLIRSCPKKSEIRKSGDNKGDNISKFAPKKAALFFALPFVVTLLSPFAPMEKKTTFIELKRHKEVQRRLQLVKRRLRHMPLELAFASGKSTALPRHIPRPPAWACGAARISSEGMNKNIAHLRPQKGKPYTIDDLMELIGHIYAICSFVKNPPKEFHDQTKELPELAEIWRPIRVQTIAGFHKFVRQISKRWKLPEDATFPSAESLATTYARQAKGLRSFSTPDGELIGFKSMTVRIYFLIWMLWPEIEHRFSGPKIHQWLKNDFGESPSDSSVEAVITRLRKEPLVHCDPNL